MNMPNLLKNLVVGAGSVLELMPASRPRFDSKLKLRSVNESLRSDWERVGQHLRQAMSKSEPELQNDGSRKQG
jgi:hypothetical protein